MSTETIQLLSPEIVLIAAAVLIYLAGAFIDSRYLWGFAAAAGIAAAAYVLWQVQESPATAAGPVTIDALAYYGRWLALAIGALLVLLAARPLDTPGTPEYVGSLLLAVAGLMLVCSAGGLVLMFLGLELISIPTYILLYLGRPGTDRGPTRSVGRLVAASQESAAKYFFLGILASAMLLYGFSFLYGTTGSTGLSAIHDALAQPEGAAAGLGMLVRVAFVLIVAGLGFKIAAVPFHFYAPDVYQGTTYTNAGLLSVLPKAAGMVALVRIVVVAKPTLPGVESYGWEPYGWIVVLVLAVLTMTFGNVMALWQENLRRLLAYSSVAHAGYMLIGLAVGLAYAGARGEWDGVSALLFYLGVYAVATIGTFAALEYLGRSDRQIEAVEELAGLGRARPLLALAMALFMFSLAGIPPLAGFYGKLFVFGSAVEVVTEELRAEESHDVQRDLAEVAGDSLKGAVGSRGRPLWPWFVALAVIGVLNAAVAAAYYLRIVAVMYFRSPLGVSTIRGGVGAWLTLTVCAVLTVVIGVCPYPLRKQSDDASRSVVADTSGEQPGVGAAAAGEESGPGVQGAGL